MSSPRPSSGWQQNVQGLRGLAITAVFLFHIWPLTFKAGYLGVDIFFVISGFLMALLLDAKKPLGLPATPQFYFRRIKRIIPTYLFVILVFLALAFFFVSPTDYRDVRSDSRKPLLFIANVPDPAADYFTKAQGGYSFFVHLWSLSTELQFYAFVPLLVFCLHRISTRLQLLVISVLSAASFYVQFASEGDYAHEALAARVWQFMAGFLAFHLQQHLNEKMVEIPYKNLSFSLPVLNGKEASRNRQQEDNGRKFFLFAYTINLLSLAAVHLRLFSFLHILLPVVLVLLLAIPLTSFAQLDRLLVTGITVLTIGLSAQSFLLTNGFLVAVGDISYSVYLIHWPLIVYHRYAFLEADFHGRHASIWGGLVLILLSVVSGQLVEDAFKRVGRHLNTWLSLSFAPIVLYAAIAGALIGLKAREVDYTHGLKTFPTNYKQIAADALRFQRTFRDNPQPLDRNASLQYARDFARLGTQAWFCDKNVRRPPTNYADDQRMGRLLHLHCTNTEGRGDKTVVVFGNSFARAYMDGVIEYFKDVASNVTLIFKNSCMFVGGPADQQACEKEREALLPMLREWKYPIDVLVFAQAFVNEDVPLETADVRKDAVFREMQTFFEQLSEIAREVVLIPQFQYEPGLSKYLKVFIRRVSRGADLTPFRTPFEYVHNFHPHTQRRMAAVECEKCVKVNWEDLWCDREAGVCNAADHVRQLPFFLDHHHLNVYGSYFAGEFLRSRYDQWMAEHAPATQNQTNLRSVRRRTIVE